MSALVDCARYLFR